MHPRFRGCIFYSLLFPYNIGFDTFSENRSIKGPIKNAVTIVPIPTIAVRPVKPFVATKYRIVPIATQLKSVMILTYLNLPIFHVFAIITATASYGDTPRSATKYNEAEKQDITIPISRKSIRIPIDGSICILCKNSSVYCAI